MADTKTKAKAKAAKPKPRAKAKAAKRKSAPGSKSRKTQSKSTQAKSAKRQATPRKSTQDKVVSAAKLPLIAGGAALAGVVGGAALGAKRSGQKTLGVPMPKPKRVQFRTKDLRKAAKEVGSFGENVGDLVAELRRAQDAVSNGKGDSPVEVLLHGLTKRR